MSQARFESVSHADSLVNGWITKCGVREWWSKGVKEQWKKRTGGERELWNDGEREWWREGEVK